jgi:hypothetical protein
MAQQSVRLADGSSTRLASGIVQFSNWRYVRDEDGNENLSFNPALAVANPQHLDVRLIDGSEVPNTVCR